jgi:hypothetical protein
VTKKCLSADFSEIVDPAGMADAILVRLEQARGPRSSMGGGAEIWDFGTVELIVRRRLPSELGT